MKVVGITGGIGSGKSFIGKVFVKLGTPLYDADKEARLLMNEDPAIRKLLTDNFGSAIYTSDKILNRKLLSDIIFTNKDARLLVNSIVHPVLNIHFENWMKQFYTKPYLLKESAILFESNAHQNVDMTLCITAPLALRIQRIKERDQISDEKINSIIASQMDEHQRNSLCDYLIINDNLTPVLPQVIKLHELISALP